MPHSPYVDLTKLYETSKAVLSQMRGWNCVWIVGMPEVKTILYYLASQH